MTQLKTAIWVEDEPDVVRPNLKVLERLGIDCELVHVKDFAAATRRKSYDLGIFDARFDIEDQEDGVALARRSVRSRKVNSVLLVTGFQERYADAERKFSPHVPVEIVSKSEMDDAREALSSRLLINDVLSENSIADVLERMEGELRLSANLQTEAPALPGDRFPLAEITVSRFYELPVREQLDIGKTVSATYRPFVNEVFGAHPDIDWIVVGAPTGEVLLWGTDQRTVPDKIQRIETIAREAIEQCVPFTFVRPTHESF